MKQHVHMFESFISYGGRSSREEFGSEEEFGSGRMGYSHGEDTDRKLVAAKTAKLIGELTRLSTDFTEISSSNEFMQKYLKGRGVSEDDAETFLKILAKMSFRTYEKKKVDQDGDGDTDFIDAKIAQYKNGGIPKEKAISKAKMFAKKNNVKDSKTKK